MTTNTACNIYAAAEDFAYWLADADPETTAEDIVDALTDRFGIDEDHAWLYAEDAVEARDAEEPDWDREMGFDPYEGCYDWDC